MSPNPSQAVESEQERLNRQLDQLLNELRVAMPGAQVLFAFLLADKPHLIAVSSKLAVAGLLCLAVAMNGAVLLVTDLLFDGTTVTITIAITAALYSGLWFVLGIVRRPGSERSH
jgi:hypothetical protein